MTRSELIEALRRLGLKSPPDQLEGLLREGTKRKWSCGPFCERLVSLETAARAARNLASRTHSATLGRFKTLDAFDWNHPTKVDRPLYERLLDLDFLRGGENVLLRGPSGVGKTTLAQNLGHHALCHGSTVRFTSLAGALADLMKQESAPALERRLKRYTGPELLILDELGYLPADTRSADLLYHVISRRHEKRSVVITTNLAFKEWGSVFPGAACVAALIDRFVQHCHVIDVVGPSYRLKDAQQHRNKSKSKPKPKPR